MILLVNNDKVMLEAYKTRLERHGFNVIALTNAQETMEQFFTHHGDISAIIADYQMLMMNGLELIQSIRQYQPGICAILIADGLIEEELPQNVSFYNIPVPFDSLIVTLNSHV